MNPIDKEDFKTIIEDARARHAAVINLIFFTDRQAMTLLRLYLTFGIASASGAVASFGTNAAVPKALGYALLAAAGCMVIGIFFCLRAMQTTTINFPGRPANFWQWALNREREEVIKAYLENLVEKNALNDTTVEKTGKAYGRAKGIAFITPLIALAVGLAYLYAPPDLLTRYWPH